METRIILDDRITACGIAERPVEQETPLDVAAMVA